MSLASPELGTFERNFTKGLDQSVPIAAEGAIVTSQANLDHMYIRLLNARDGAEETFILDPAFSRPSLRYEVTTLAPSKAQVGCFRGRA